MFDIGFAELIIIAVVGLLVIGPERLPGAIRTGSAWLSRIRRGFNDIKREVEVELHNDAVMRELKDAGQQLKSEGEKFGQEVKQAQRKAEQELDAKITPPEPPAQPNQESQPRD